MAIIKDFKGFISRGNVVDLAIGVIMGGAFGRIVSSLVGDILMPPLGLVLGKVNFTELKFNIGGWVGSKTPVTINYGNFLQTSFDFLAVSLCVFLLVQAINRIKRLEGDAPPEEKPPSPEEKLLTEIRDILKARVETPPAAGVRQ